MKTKKRFVLIIAAVLVLTLCVTFAASAEEESFTESHYTYIIEDGEATIIDVDAAISGDVVIPETLGGYNVRNIGDGSFAGCYNLASVEIPYGVKEIGSRAFMLSFVRSVTIPDSVLRIGDAAFYECNYLECITIPDSVISIGDMAFSDTNVLHSITVDENNNYYSSDEYGVLFNKNKTKLIQHPEGNTRTLYTVPQSVTDIGDNAFYYCINLTDISIPSKVTKIGYSAFYNCYNLVNISLPESLNCVGENAFYNCEKIKSVIIPDGVTEISDGLFRNCVGLETVVIGKGVKRIGAYAFDFCTSLNNISIPCGVEVIDEEAFSYCYGLTNMTIPDGITTIGDKAFWFCTNITEVTIPVSVTHIGNYVFSSCNELKDIYYLGTKEQWRAISIGGWDDDNTTVHYLGTAPDEPTTEPEEPSAEPDTPDEPTTEPETPDEPADSDCPCNCHKGGIMGFIWKILNLFYRIFKINPVCACGVAHY